jgi:hypothetical protein
MVVLANASSVFKLYYNAPPCAPAAVRHFKNSLRVLPVATTASSKDLREHGRAADAGTRPYVLTKVTHVDADHHNATVDKHQTKKAVPMVNT